jgi:hypothetical protein
MKTHRLILHLAGLLVLMSAFQNCTKGFSSAGKGSDLPLGHPDTGLVIMQSHVVLGDREYLESAFSNVFSQAGVTSGQSGYLANVLLQEFLPQQGSLGRACDPLYDGSIENCYYLIDNANINMSAASSSIREAARIQVCRRLLANDLLLQAMIGQVSGNQSTPNAQSVTAIIQQYYPAKDSAPSLIDSLLNLDATMAKQGESTADRWRLIFLALCESPEWEVL